MPPITYCSVSIMPFFQNVEMLQANIDAVTTHIRKKLEEKGEKDIERKVLRFLPADTGKTYWHDGENYWRVMAFIPMPGHTKRSTPNIRIMQA